ncbi:unknown protein (plasmid) [Nostoc sp. NIES-3756]|jgi:hypothetical protein|uniref:hypothetical protein n=1 Tax=Nostoc sp. NIES-3756 TaxID=1751286 RepID=UPI00071F019C|nr:hypothetical protein [Nostoc sp. NIES-3756]BAT56879.1 unknown protein [Nostoc sp. NIES-3756]BAY41783.1 hypothetical protein NIES2111_61790 [Nostoc sp. NIES-2111]
MTQQQEQVNYFQAIGVISGTVKILGTLRAIITISGVEYDLIALKSKHQPLVALKSYLEKNNTQLATLMVYPKAVHFPKKDQPYQIYFELITHRETPIGIFEELSDGEFKLSGIWQFIPVCEIPCISIYKNLHSDRLDFIKTVDTSLKVKFMKPSHLPLIWHDATVPPFKFNHHLPKSEQDKRYFIQVKAKFSPQENNFIFDSLIGLPTQDLPKFLKASKKDKVKVVKEKRKKTSAKQIDPESSQPI